MLQGLILLALPLCWPSAARADEKAELLAAFNQAQTLERKGEIPAAARSYQRALDLAPRVFGPEHPNTAVILNNLGNLYVDLGQYAQAEPLHLRSLQIRRSQLGPNHPDVAVTLYNLANLYNDMGQYAKAEPLYLESLKIKESRLRPNHLEVAACLNNLGNLYKDMGQYAKAEPLYQRSLKIRESRLGPDHLDVAASLNNLAILYDEMGQYARALPLFQRSLKIKESRLGPNHPNVADCLSNLANLYKDMGQYAQAEPLYQRSLQIRESRLGPDHPDVAESLSGLAVLYQELGQYAKAEPLGQRSLQIRQSKLGPDHLYVAGSLNNLAQLYWKMGQYARAEPLYQRSIEIKQSHLGPDHPNVAGSLSNLAALYRDMGRYDRAEPLCLRSLKIRQAALGPDHPEVAQSLDNLAVLYESMGQYAQAEPLYLQSIKIREAKLGPDHPELAASLNNLANLYTRTGQYARAEPLHQRSLQIKQSKLGPDHPDLATALNNLAALYFAMDQYARAEPLYRRSLQIRESQLGPEHLDVAHSLNNLANLYWIMGQYAQAEPLYRRSLAIKQSKLGPDHPDVANFGLHNLVCLHTATGHWSEAVAEADQARRIVRRHVARTLPILNEKEQLTFLETQDETCLHVALSLGLHERGDIQSAPRSAGWVLNGKAVAQEVLAQRAILAAEGSDPALAELVKQLLAVRSQLAALSLAAPQPGQEAPHRQELDSLNRQEQELSRRLGQATGRTTSGDPWVEPEAVRKALAQDALLIEIARFRVDNFQAKGKEKRWLPPHYAAWLIPAEGKGAIAVVDLGEAGPIDDAVQQARQALEKAETTIREAGETAAEKQVREAMGPLTRLVWEPLAAHFGDARELILSPDAALWLVPWAALPLADGTYAIEKYRIRYLISGRDLVSQAASKAAKPTDPVLFANPDYDLGPGETAARTRAVLRSMAPAKRMAGSRGVSSVGGLGRAERLPGTAAEAAAIRPSVARYARSEPLVYEDQYALEGVFKSLHGPQVLVLSTHGFFLPDQELAQPVERPAGLADEGLDTQRGRAVLTTAGQPLENPLLRCGLLLAGCNQRASTEGSAEVDDGILTGLEIVGTDLRGTDLVVLSACETGLGQVRNGEGVAGLRQAFQLAGAKAVVATLWQIPDEETVALMKAFFGNLSALQSKAEALRSAQLSLIKTRREAHSAAHPYYWAAFTVTGE